MGAIGRIETRASGAFHVDTAPSRPLRGLLLRSPAPQRSRRPPSARCRPTDPSGRPA